MINSNEGGKLEREKANDSARRGIEQEGLEEREFLYLVMGKCGISAQGGTAVTDCTVEEAEETGQCALLRIEVWLIITIADPSESLLALRLVSCWKFF